MRLSQSPKKLAILFTLGGVMACAAGDSLEDRRALAKEYALLPANQQMISDMLSPKVMRSNLEVGMPQGLGIPDEVLDEAAAVLSEEILLKKPELNGVMVEAAAQNFTIAELEAMIAFYSTPEGASAAAKMGTYMVDVNRLMAPTIQEVQTKAQPRLMEIFMNAAE